MNGRVYVTNYFHEFCKHMELGLCPSSFLFSVHPGAAGYKARKPLLGWAEVVRVIIVCRFSRNYDSS